MRSDPLFRVVDSLRRALPQLLGVAALTLVAGGAIILWGIYPIGARGGHAWPVEQMIRLTKTRSVALHAGSVPEPRLPLTDSAVLRRGAAHYDLVCAGCHGAPGQVRPAFTRELLPRPPALANGEIIGKRSPAELYWVVEHGLKFTGMPGWPIDGRADEVWAVVGLLEALPDLEPAEYRALAGRNGGVAEGDGRLLDGSGASSSVPDAVAGCARCHGRDGAGDPSGAFPNLTLQSGDYLELALDAYADGRRHSGFMATQVAGLDSATLARLARYYGSRPVRIDPRTPVDSSLAARGREIAEVAGVPERGLSECNSCHGAPQRSGLVAEELPRYPRLDGQFAPYLREQLTAWVEGSRGGNLQRDPEVEGAHQLTPDEIRAVAAWYASRDAEAYRRAAEQE